MKRLLVISSLLSLAYFNACTKTDVSPPEEVVKNFVTLSSSASALSDKKKLAEISTNEMQEAFSKMSDENFKKTYLDKKIVLKDFKIVASQVGTESAEIRYLVSVDNNSGTAPASESNVREVLLMLREGTWKIAAVRIFGTDHLVFNQGMNF